MRRPREYNERAKLQCTRPRRSKITTGHGGGTASVAFGAWTYRHAALHDTESVGEVIDASCPQTNEVPA
jgi:hypothetical protein